MYRTFDDMMRENFEERKIKGTFPPRYPLPEKIRKTEQYEWNSHSKFYKPSRRRWFNKHILNECFPLGSITLSGCKITFYMSNVEGLFWACPSDHAPYQVEFQSMCRILKMSAIDVMARCYLMHQMIIEAKKEATKKKRDKELKELQEMDW
jgi:hypothetical protein